jgi:hypothetical protein
VTESRKTNATKTHMKYRDRSNWDERNTNDNCNKSMNKYKINHNLSFQIIYTGVPGGKDKTSGECSLGQTIQI